MAKRIVFSVLEFIAFGALLYVGGWWDAVNLGIELRAMQNHTQPGFMIPTVKFPVGSHILIANGLIYAGVLLVLILLVQAARRKFSNMPWTVAAFVLAAAIAMVLKIGLPPA